MPYKAHWQADAGTVAARGDQVQQVSGEVVRMCE